jgi:molybdate transport system ATP-binding protein
LHLEGGAIRQTGTPSELFAQQRLTRSAGQLTVQAQLLTIRHEPMAIVLSFLVGQDIIEVIATEDEVQGLRQGDMVSLAAQVCSPLNFHIQT